MSVAWRNGLFLLLLCPLVAGCAQTDKVAGAKNLEKRFHVGMSAADVEKVLKQEEVEYCFAAMDNAYYAILRNTGCPSCLVRENVSLTIYLDDKQLVKEVKVQKAFTGP